MTDDIQETLTHHSTLSSKPPKSAPSIRKGFLFGFILTIGLSGMQVGFSYNIQVYLSTILVPILWHDKDSTEIADTKRFFQKMNIVCSVAQVIGSLSIALFTRHGKRKCLLVANMVLMVGSVLTFWKT